ncbi:MAG TPA: hypothetical protein VFM27_15110 [Acidimicrobiales bacterium]|nr:hypothetical protein [Acidimicrobiales bacterium]
MPRRRVVEAVGDGLLRGAPSVPQDTAQREPARRRARPEAASTPAAQPAQ